MKQIEKVDWCHIGFPWAEASFRPRPRGWMPPQGGHASHPYRPRLPVVRPRPVQTVPPRPQRRQPLGFEGDEIL